MDYGVVGIVCTYFNIELLLSYIFGRKNMRVFSIEFLKSVQFYFIFVLFVIVDTVLLVIMDTVLLVDIDIDITSHISPEDKCL